MKNFDIILGMDWLQNNRARVDYYKKEIEFYSRDESSYTFLGHWNSGIYYLISSFKAYNLLRSAEYDILVSAMNLDSVFHVLENISVERELTDVFPEELLGLPPATELEFIIEVAQELSPYQRLYTSWL